MESENVDRQMYIMFENNMNNCWLDASMALIAYNKTIKQIASNYPDSKVGQIIATYNKAISLLNDFDQSDELRIKTARKTLYDLQLSTLNYLQPRMKTKKGEPDSALCALMNLLFENKAIKENLKISWLWEKKCSNCNRSELPKREKPIITLSRVNIFNPDQPASIYQCSCKTEQEMKLRYRELPPVIFFHFENGAGEGESPPLFFTIQCRKYQLTAVITLAKSREGPVNHFITWIRDPPSNNWLECNDLNSDIIYFSSEKPAFDLKDVYMFVYESLGKLGKMRIEEPADQLLEQNVQKTNFEFIDLSDESEDVKSGNKPKENQDEMSTITSAIKSDQFNPHDQSKEGKVSVDEINKQVSTNVLNKWPQVLKMYKKMSVFSKAGPTNEKHAKSTIIDYCKIPVTNVQRIPPNFKLIKFVKEMNAAEIKSNLECLNKTSESDNVPASSRTKTLDDLKIVKNKLLLEKKNIDSTKPDEQGQIANCDLISTPSSSLSIKKTRHPKKIKSDIFNKTEDCDYTSISVTAETGVESLSLVDQKNFKTELSTEKKNMITAPKPKKQSQSPCDKTVLIVNQKNDENVVMHELNPVQKNLREEGFEEKVSDISQMKLCDTSELQTTLTERKEKKPTKKRALPAQNLIEQSSEKSDEKCVSPGTSKAATPSKKQTNIGRKKTLIKKSQNANSQIKCEKLSGNASRIKKPSVDSDEDLIDLLNSSFTDKEIEDVLERKVDRYVDKAYAAFLEQVCEFHDVLKH